MAITDIFAPSDNEDAALQYRRKMAAALLQQGMSPQQIIHPMQGVAQLGQALIGGLLMNSAASAEKDRERERDLGLAGTIEKLYGGGGGVGTPRSFSEATTPAGSGVASVRNNNPGAMYPGPSASDYGSTSHENLSTGHKIAQFPDAESGGAAMFDLLDRNYKGMTLSDAINKWSGGNNAHDYTSLVTGRTGLPSNTRLTRELLMSPQGIELAKAMASHEAGGGFPMADQQWLSAQGRSVGSGRPLGPIVAATPLGPDNTPPAAARPMPPPAQVASNDPNFIPVPMAYAQPTGAAGATMPPPATSIPPGSSPAPAPPSAAPTPSVPPPSPIQMAQAGPAPMSGADRQREMVIRMLRSDNKEERLFGRALAGHLIQKKLLDEPSWDFTTIGEDDYGNKQYGWINKRDMRIIPAQTGAASTQRSGVPEGVNPKLYRDENTKSVAKRTLPADFEETQKLRKEIQDIPAYKNLAQAAPIYKTMKEAASHNTKASDLNMVYGLGKIFDPGSVVREGEMIMVKNTASLPDWLVGTINALNGGAALTPETRAAIMREAHSRVNAYKSEFDQQMESQYKGIVNRRSMNTQDVIPTFGPFEEWAPIASPQPTASPAAPVAQPQPTRKWRVE